MPRKPSSARGLWQIRLVAVLVAALVTLAACSGDDGNDAATASNAGDGSAMPSTTTPAPTTTVADSTAICAVFGELAASGAGAGAQFEASTPDGWERRIATNQRIVDAAPAEWRDEAEIYLQMVKDRAQLAAENGYVGVDELPADVRDGFIDSHRAMQAEVNELIAFMGAACGVSTAG